MPSKAEVTPWNREEYAETGDIRLKRVRRLLGENFLFVQRIQFAASAKQAGRVNGLRRDEAATKNEDYEGCDKED